MITKVVQILLATRAVSYTHLDVYKRQVPGDIPLKYCLGDVIREDVVPNILLQLSLVFGPVCRRRRKCGWQRLQLPSCTHTLVTRPFQHSSDEIENTYVLSLIHI